MDAEKHEEEAYLLLYDKLPNQEELNNYKTLLRSYRDLLDSLKEVLQRLASSSNGCNENWNIYAGKSRA